jgi:hypothetical protein
LEINESKIDYIPRVEGLGDHHDVKVGDSVEITVLLDFGVLLDDDDAILEDSLVNSLLNWGWNQNHLETKPIKYRLADRDFFDTKVGPYFVTKLLY